MIRAFAIYKKSKRAKDLHLVVYPVLATSAADALVSYLNERQARGGPPVKDERWRERLRVFEWTHATKPRTVYFSADDVARHAAELRTHAEQLAASVARAPGDGWEPINTAPMRGRVLWVDVWNGERVTRAHYACGGGEEQPPFGPAWFESIPCGAGRSFFGVLHPQPTHWRRGSEARDV
jgi:hypothetical protein